MKCLSMPLRAMKNARNSPLCGKFFWRSSRGEHLEFDLGRQGRRGLERRFSSLSLPSRQARTASRSSSERRGVGQQVAGIAADRQRLLQGLDVLVVLAQQGADMDGQLAGRFAAAAAARRQQLDLERADGEIAGPEKGDGDDLLEGAPGGRAHRRLRVAGDDS